MNGEIPCEQQYAGKTVEILSPARNSENDPNVESDYVAAYQPLMDCTGVEITWSGTDQFETEVNVRLEGGNPPDVIDYPQPGLLAANATRRLPDPAARRHRRPREERLHRRLGHVLHRRRQGLRHARSLQRQVDGVVQPVGVRRRRLRDPDRRSTS